MSAWNLQSFSLRTKLVLFAAVLVVAPGVISGAITVFSSRATLASMIGRRLAEESRDSADRIGAVLRSQREGLASFARQDVMREIRIGDLDKRISSFLASVVRADPACLDLLVVDRDGRVVASSSASLIGTAGGVDPSRESSTIAGPLESPLHHRKSLRFSVPIPDPDSPSPTIGWLVAFYDWQREIGALSRVRENLAAAGLDADVLVVDSDGLVIGGTWAESDPWKEGERFGGASSADQGPASPAVAGILDPEAGLIFGRASLSDDLPAWTVVVAQPLSEAFAPARRAARLLALVLAGTLVVALALAIVAARRVTRPLAELTTAAKEIGRGRAATAVPVRSRDEIGTFASAFNRMAVDLRRAERELLDAAKFAFVGELAAGVAHEVRTPLGVLRSSAQLLERSLEGKDAEARELLQLLREEVDRIDRVVSGLLDLARPREMRPEPAVLGQIVFRAADFAEAQAREKGVGIRRLPAQPDPTALCDPELVYQVALNLVVNAIQVLQAGGTVEIAIVEPRGGFAGFEVRDDGPGIPEEFREKIFRPFFTQRNGGAGLGLTFVQRVVQEHRGRVAVETMVGRGTVFRVELPVPEGSE